MFSEINEQALATLKHDGWLGGKPNDWITGDVMPDQTKQAELIRKFPWLIYDP